jgi:TetR/AcrR family transcriptional regulator, cholesterol catabolism regulator
MAKTTKKEAILDAALALFAEKGIDATTTREIAERADTAEGNLYRHFEGKDDLARTLFETTARRFADVLKAEAGDEDDPAARLDALIRGIFTFGESHAEAFAFLLASHPSHIPKDRDLLLGPYPMRLFVETIVRGVSQGAFRAMDPVLATGWIVAMAQRAVLLARMGLLAHDREHIIGETVEASRRILTPDPA